MAIDIDVQTLRDRVGQEVAVSDWMTISQETINQFADATGDHQWIHVDRARAEQSTFKTTIAHGFLTLSLTSALLRNAINPTGLRMAINYGLNRVRFIAPVPSGSRIRGTIRPGRRRSRWGSHPGHVERDHRARRRRQASLRRRMARPLLPRLLTCPQGTGTGTDPESVPVPDPVPVPGCLR